MTSQKFVLRTAFTILGMVHTKCHSTRMSPNQNISVPPEWLEWTSWSPCSRTCGPRGIRSRSRDFIPGRHGADRSPKGDKQESQECTNSTIPGWPTCPRPPKHGEWGNWTQCSETCYPEGSLPPTIFRSRRCIEAIFSTDDALNTNIATCATLPEIRESRQCAISPCEGDKLCEYCLKQLNKL